MMVVAGSESECKALCSYAADSVMERAVLQINNSKTEAIDFSRRRLKDKTIQAGHDSVNLKRSLCYLGVILDSNLTFKHHVMSSGFSCVCSYVALD